MPVHIAVLIVTFTFLVIAVAQQHKKAVYWENRWKDAVTRLDPVDWDYTREKGWRYDA